MRHVGPVRRELGVRTVFNFLGPLTNPAGARRQTIGVSDAVMAPKMADALLQLGVDHAWVFRGEDGLDELSTTTESRVWDVNGVVRASTVSPESVGIARATPADLAGGAAADNARICVEVLAGAHPRIADVVALNAGAALLVAGISPDLADGVARARESISSGAAAGALDRMRTVSQRVRG